MPRPRKEVQPAQPPAASPTKPKVIKPAPITSALMPFSMAMKNISEGKYVTKLEWNNPMTVGFLRDYLMIKIDGKDFQWIVSSGDMAGQDFIVIDPWPPDEEEWKKYVESHKNTILSITDPR